MVRTRYISLLLVPDQDLMHNVYPLPDGKGKPLLHAPSGAMRTWLSEVRLKLLLSLRSITVVSPTDPPGQARHLVQILLLPKRGLFVLG